MQIPQQKSHKKAFIITSVVIAVLLVAGGVYWFVSSKNNIAKQDQTTTQPLDKSNTKSKNSDKSTTDNKDTAKDGNSTDSTTVNGSNNVGDNTNYVDPPISNPPTDTTPYPIQNSHYEIKQLSQTHYAITLYPIVNNPDYSDYNTQLKAYKNEVLSYLKNRYGDISHFTLDWTPSNAKDI